MSQDTLTPLEKRVLNSTMINSGRAAQGALTEREIRLLKGLAPIEEILKVRYPHHDFRINGMNDCLFNGTVWDLQGVSGTDVFQIKAVSADMAFGDMKVEDSLYALIKRREAAELLLKVLRDAGAADPRVLVSIQGIFDENYDRSAFLEETLAAGKPITLSAQIFLREQDDPALDTARLTGIFAGGSLTMFGSLWRVGEFPAGEPSHAWITACRAMKDTACYPFHAGGED